MKFEFAQAAALGRPLAAVTAAGVVAFATGAGAETFDRNALEELVGEPITVSATGAPLRATDAPVNMTILTQEDIRRSGAPDLPGVLERLASIDVMRSFRGQADVSIRGYNSTMSPRLLVLLNGRQVYLDHYGVTNWDVIPVQLAEIRQIEVVNGPNTALFGFNAVAGVVNIITFDAVRDDIDAASATIGDPQFAGASGVWTAQLNERLGFRLSAGGFDAQSSAVEDALSRTLIGVDARDPSARTAAFNLGYNASDRLRGDFEVTWAQGDRAGRFLTSALSERYETSSLKGALAADTSLGMLSTQVYRNFLTHETLSLAGQTMQEAVSTIASASLVGKPAPAHILRAGVEYRRNELSQGFGDELGYDILALSGMWDWKISDKLSLTSAARVDALSLARTGPGVTPGFPLGNAEYDRDMTETSWNVGLVYRLTSADVLRLAAARGVASPSLNEFGVQAFNQVGPVTLYFAGDPRISSAIVDNIEIGWDHDFADGAGRFRVTAFWQQTEDIKFLGALTTPLDATTLLTLADNIGASEMTGIELGVDGHSGRLRWNAQYSLRDINDDLDVLGAPPVDFERASPAHVATAGAAWISESWELGADMRYTGETVQQGFLPSLPAPVPEIPTKAYVQANARVAWLPQKNLRLELSGRNLLQEQTQTVGAAPVERGVFFTIERTF